MKIIDRIMGKLGYGRRQSPNFPAAAINRLTSDWTTSTLSSDSQLKCDLKTLRARSRVLRDGNDYANKFAGMMRSGIVGDQGIAMRLKIRGEDRLLDGRWVKGELDLQANRAVEKAWNDWCKRDYCTVQGTLTWRDVQHIAAEAVAVDGEVLIRLVRTRNNPYGISLHVMESDYLDIDKEETLAGNRSIRMGVELDEWHKPVAYHILKKNPNDSHYYSTETRTQWERVPATEMIHAFLARRPEQTRGWPWISSAMTRIQMLGGFQEASLVASRLAASKMGFFETVGDQKYAGPDDGTGNRTMEASPGSFEVLPTGMKLSTWDPGYPKIEFGDFCKEVLRGISAGMGISYNSLANDFESVNFSSARYATGEERENYKSLQRWFIDQVCVRVFESWLDMALMAGAIEGYGPEDFDYLNQCDWKPRRWAYINPVEEIQAYNDAIANGLTSRTRVLAEMNIDIEDVYEELKNEEDLADKYEIVVPYHPFYYGQVSGKAPQGKGVAPNTQPQNGEGDEDADGEDEDEIEEEAKERQKVLTL